MEGLCLIGMVVLGLVVLGLLRNPIFGVLGWLFEMLGSGLKVAMVLGVLGAMLVFLLLCMDGL